MKKTMIINFIVLFGIALIAPSCSSEKKIGMMEGDSYRTQGWIDENTFRIAARGAYPKGDDEENPIVRQEMAKRAAILSAQYQVLEKFTGAKVTGAAGMKDFRTTGIAVSQEVAGSIRGGSVYSEKYDDNGCEVIYEVKAKGLQKKVQATQIKGEGNN